MPQRPTILDANRGGLQDLPSMETSRNLAADWGQSTSVTGWTVEFFAGFSRIQNTI
jgi:hypothetical protein